MIKSSYGICSRKCKQMLKMFLHEHLAATKTVWVKEPAILRNCTFRNAKKASHLYKRHKTHRILDFKF